MKSKYEILFYEVIISEFTAVWVEKVGDCHCPLLQTPSRKEILFATSPAFFDTVCISSCWNIANFYCQFLAREWRLCTIALSFYAISSRRGFKKHIKSTAVHCNNPSNSKLLDSFLLLRLDLKVSKFSVSVNPLSFRFEQPWQGVFSLKLAGRQHTNWGNGVTKLPNYSHSNLTLLLSGAQIFSLQHSTHYKIFLGHVFQNS